MNFKKGALAEERRPSLWSQVYAENNGPGKLWQVKPQAFLLCQGVKHVAWDKIELAVADWASTSIE